MYVRFISRQFDKKHEIVQFGNSLMRAWCSNGTIRFQWHEMTSDCCVCTYRMQRDSASASFHSQLSIRISSNTGVA